jgi:regulator of protease activity HflC (stomatin/prohibitin superfamily)
MAIRFRHHFSMRLWFGGYHLKMRSSDQPGFGATLFILVIVSMAMARREFFIKDTHRGLWYEDGKLLRVLEAGRYEIPRYINLRFYRRPKVEVILVDVRERDLTIKGQEILTGDKVAIRVSIIVQFRVTDPRAALHEVENYEERLYGDVQLAARRSLASMNLEEILTNRNRLSEDILRDVKGSASTYGVAIFRADVKDLIFPGNLQEIMNRVLAAERMSQAQLVEARTKAEVQRINAEAAAETQRLESEARVLAERLAAESAAEVQRIKTEADIRALRDREQAAQAYSKHPALLRLRELETLHELARSANARIYIGFDKYARPSIDNETKE